VKLNADKFQLGLRQAEVPFIGHAASNCKFYQISVRYNMVYECNEYNAM